MTNGYSLKVMKEESPRSTPVLDEYGFTDLEEANELCNDARASTWTRSSRAFSPSLLKTPCGPTPWARPSPSRRACKTAAEAAEAIGDRPAGVLHPRLRRRAAPGGPGPRQPGRHAAARGDQVLLPSWPATSPSPPPRAPSASPAPPTRSARSPCASSSTAWARTPPTIISRINGFTYVETEYDYRHRRAEDRARRTAYSDGERAKVKCYGADDVLRGRGHHAA